ncbi:MAG: hypothetical protein ABSC15_14725 [Terriglobales bacterium]|jgi:hypothetical protein
MHVHANQTNPNIQLNILYAAEKAEANRETERTRKKLMEFASVLSGEAGEACVVKLGAHDGSEEQAKQDQQNENRSRKKQNEPANGEGRDSSISDWA